MLGRTNKTACKAKAREEPEEETRVGFHDDQFSHLCALSSMAYSTGFPVVIAATYPIGGTLKVGRTSSFGAPEP